MLLSVQNFAFLSSSMCLFVFFELLSAWLGERNLISGIPWRSYRKFLPDHPRIFFFTNKFIWVSLGLSIEKDFFFFHFFMEPSTSWERTIMNISYAKLLGYHFFFRVLKHVYFHVEEPRKVPRKSFLCAMLQI